MAPLPDKKNDGTACREKKDKDDEEEKGRHLKQIGQLRMEVDWLKKCFASLTTAERRAILDKRESELSMRRQCDLLSVSRSGGLLPAEG